MAFHFLKQKFGSYLTSFKDSTGMLQASAWKKNHSCWQQFLKKTRQVWLQNTERITHGGTVITIITCRLWSHWQGSTDKTSKSWTLPRPGLQHKGLFHTASNAVVMRKTLNATALQLHPALGVALCCSKSWPLLEVLKHIQRQLPLQLQPSFKSGSKCQAEVNACTSNAFARSNLGLTDLSVGFASSGIKQQYFGLSSTVPRWHQEKHVMKIKLIKGYRETVCTTEQQNGLHCIGQRCWTSTGAETTSLP